MDDQEPRNDDITVKLLDLFSLHSTLFNLNVNDDFFAVGGTQDSAKQLIEEINENFGQKLSLDDLKANPTVAKFARKISNDRSVLDYKVIPLNTQRDKPVIYFICGIALYASLAKRLVKHFSCYGIYVPEEKEVLDSEGSMTIEDLAACYVKAIEQHGAKGPIVLAGVSFGGILAFEIARQLSRKNVNIVGLVILDTVLDGALKKSWALRKKHLLNKISTIVHRVRNFKQPQPKQKQSHKDRPKRMWFIVKGKVTREYFAKKPTFAGDTLIVRAQEQEGHKLVPDMLWIPKLTGAVILVESPGSHLGILQCKETAEHIVNYICPTKVNLA